MERLQKLIANLGVTSRRKAEELIQMGKVKVNGVIAKIGDKATEEDLIEIEGKIINNKIKKVYYLLYKPKGYITSVRDEKKRKTVCDLIDEEERIYPVGRLDYNTEGALILTNDGELTNILTHPKTRVAKVYEAKVEGIINREDIKALKEGIVIDGRKVETANFKIKSKNMAKNTSVIVLTIYEGRNHIVKRIMQKINHPVLKLKRIKIDFLTLEGLKKGEARKLSIKEVRRLYRLK